MRIRAGIVLIEDNKVALIERHRQGRHYFTFPGGGMDEGESVEQAAVREAREELGLTVALKQQLAEIHFNTNLQYYYLAEKIDGEFGTGTGEEFGEFDPMSGTYQPIWMAISELPEHEDVHPAFVAELVMKSQKEGWPKESQVFFEESK
jgi:8-oxo-dGTP diphosphatase